MARPAAAPRHEVCAALAAAALAGPYFVIGTGGRRRRGLAARRRVWSPVLGCAVTARSPTGGSAT